MAQLDNLLRMFKEFNRRILAMEAVYQAKVLQFGDIVLDAANNRITVGADNEIIIDGNNKRILVKDASTNRVWIDGASGALKICKAGYNVLTATSAQMIIDTDSLALAIGNLSKVVNPGPRQWTENNAYTNINSTEFQVNGDDFALMKVHFHCLGCVETAGRTGYFRIYNVTDAGALADSEVSTGGVSSEGEGWINAVLMTSSALTFPSGDKKYRLQFYQDIGGGAGDNVQFMKGELLFKPT